MAGEWARATKKAQKEESDLGFQCDDTARAGAWQLAEGSRTDRPKSTPQGQIFTGESILLLACQAGQALARHKSSGWQKGLSFCL